ncbi:ComEC/Rec2 family competence protein [Gemelliphila palaticanis]|uniref:ComEC/Rec2 family competence protein n=1 Tax=Gemelliphila palaticanis TaxID=81950 RepID=A0ABX2SYC7_9BACL|nr:ComEC/Rec2 family competence protein [Gemella palaticanis]MBF0715264.1 ComEC/Rec2 family competence protein [Gemella palaticanis]NYS47194.1 ComEC/Rec2 family competence protein [Gemella palaticanis]
MKLFIYSIISLISVLLALKLYMFSSVLLLLVIILIYLNKEYFEVKETIILILVFLTFFIRTSYSQYNHYSKLEDSSDNFQVEIVDKLNINGNFLKTYGYINNEKVIVNYKIENEQEKEYFVKDFKGGTFLVGGSIEDIKEKKNFYSFDYKQYLNRKGIFKVLNVEKINNINYEFSSTYKKVLNFRTNLIRNISNNIKFNEKGYFEALIYGDKTNMFRDDIEDYRNLGISHLLAISGLHIATLIMLIYKTLKLFSINSKLIDKVIFITLPIYSIFAGLSASVIRATLMILIFLLLKRKQVDSIKSLIIVFLITIFYNPYFIYDIGFQFSFFITFSILMSKSFIESGNNKILKLFKVSLIAWLASLPINLFNFYSISFISIFSNIIFVPYFTLIIFPLILVSYLIFIISSKVFDFICVPILNGAFYVQNIFEKILNYFSFEVFAGKQEDYIALAIVILILAIIIYVNKGYYKEIIYLSTAILFLIFINNNFLKDELYEKLSINGQNVYYLTTRNNNILINTSNNSNNFYKDFRKKENNYDIINEYNNLLAYDAKNSIEFLIITKTKLRDIGYARNLIGKDKVKKLYVTEQILNNDKILEIIDVSKFKNIDIEIIKNNSIFYLNDIKFTNKDTDFIVSYLDKEININKDKLK